MIECLQKLVNERREEVLEWIAKASKNLDTPIYSSFDIRDNGTKATIVDSNLFPAGFNNLTHESIMNATKNFKEFIPTLCEKKTILIIPEAHTRNVYYLSNLKTLKLILTEAGYNVILGSIREDIEETMKVEDSEGRTLTLEKMKNVGGKLHTKNFQGGMILLNNDFSTKAPELLENVKSCIAPPLQLGWLHRKKYSFFKHFCKSLDDFSESLDIDKWLLCPITDQVQNINFGTGENMEAVADAVDKMLEKIKTKYDEYNVTEEPYVYVKDNSGTYGMGIITLHSGKEILELNSKQRRKMKTGKEQHPINSVLLQEGVSTKFKTNGSTAEPVLYCVGGKVVGGFMRTHESKDDRESLNAPGAKFDVLLKNNITKPIIDFMDENKELSLYSVLANIGTVAIGHEMKEAEQKK